MRAVVALLLLVGSSAAAEEHVLRIGTIAPEGTGWAHEFRALGADIAATSHDNVRIKWYMGGIAGDELQAIDRVRRGQLDGVISGGMACETAMPSLRVLRIPGVLQTWAEASYIIGRLRGTLVDEAQKSGFVFLAEAIVGPSIVFSRRPVASLADLRSMRYWVWDIDKMISAFLPAIGVPVELLPIRDATRAYDEGRVDGFISPAVAALGFQWSTAARYYTDLRIGFVVGCMLISNRAFDALPLDQQQAMRVATAKGKVRIEEVGRTQEAQLLNGLFAKQGLRQVPTDERIRVSFFEATRSVRDRAATRLVPPELITRVLGYLADYRSEH